MHFLIAAVIALALPSIGCVRVHPVIAVPKMSEFQIARSRSEVFDAAVATGQRMNLDVPVLEKQSGFLRFEYANLSPQQLDLYCEYPYALNKTNHPDRTFAEWADDGPLSGLVQLVIVMSETGSQATNVAIRSRCRVVAPMDSRPKGFRDVAANDCNSTGTLEREFVTGIESRLGVK